MKRMWASLIIFTALVAVCIFGTNNTKKASAETIQTVTAAKEAQERGDTAAAIQLSRKAGQDWKNLHRTLCIYMPHSSLEAIDLTLAELPMLSRYDANEQFSAECDRCVVQLSYLTESELPNMQNIF